MPLAILLRLLPFFLLNKLSETISLFNISNLFLPQKHVMIYVTLTRVTIKSFSVLFFLSWDRLEDKLLNGILPKQTYRMVMCYKEKSCTSTNGLIYSSKYCWMNAVP